MAFTIVLAVVAFIWKDDWIEMVLPKVEKVTVGEISISDDVANVSMELVIQNKKYLSYNLKSLTLSVYNDSISLLQYARDSGLVLNKNERKMIALDFDLPIKKIMKRVKSLQSSDSTEIKIIGVAVFSTPFGDYTLPINERQIVKVPNLVKVKVEEVQYNGKKDDKYLLEAKIKITNPNDEKLEIKNVSYDFYGEDLFEVHGKYLGQLSVQPMGHVWLTLPLQVKIENKFKLISKMILNKDVIKYKLTMKGQIESVAGVTQEIPIKLNTHGRVELLDKHSKNNIRFTLEKKHKRKKK